MSILRECIAYNRQQKVIILACLALFLPFYITCIIDLVLLIYCLIKKDLQKAYKSVDKAFDYKIPEFLTNTLKIGMRVLIPFGFQELEGYV